MTPASEAETAEMVASAKSALRIQGGGTRNIGAQNSGTPFSTAALSGVRLYEPGALTIVAGAGTPMAEIEATLASENQRLAFEPVDHRGVLGTNGTPTIGGAVAANVSGPRRIQAGACRDSLLGVLFVDGAGRILKNGGRVMKNVTGYDLVKLMAGSWGTLGVLTEVSLKVQAIPEAAGTVTLHGLDAIAATKAMSAALGSPYDVSGAAHLPVGKDGTAVTMIRVEGLETSVAYRTEKLKALLASTGADIAITHNAATAAQEWAWVRDVTPFHNGAGDVWRISVKPTDGPQVVAAIEARAPGAQVIYDWGGGLIWVEVAPDTDVRAVVSQGHATLLRASDATKDRLRVFQPEPAPLTALSAGLRTKFDPRSILNPGLME
ncbi:FAD-binding protein [Shimia sp. MMG029]|uniref:FAD-binding protein n=1 Tax=Shimia sp. MMG029 TaxID=3021978 RepID=UPI0022FDC76D|nr:FAD-binding protein [Shimia sp. MMG029]MDA5557545.1 FAD-binding protein [Shimia sp. MMG029]